jgi:hypothetical protein
LTEEGPNGLKSKQSDKNCKEEKEIETLRKFKHLSKRSLMSDRLKQEKTR